MLVDTTTRHRQRSPPDQPAPNRMDRRISSHSNRTRTYREHAGAVGIEVIPGILTYHPASTVRELRQSLNVIDACGYVSTWQFLCEVFAHPGTTLWHQYRRAGWLAEEWPVPVWEFQDPRAKRVRDAVLQAVKNGGGHRGTRAAFAEALDEWETPPLSEDCTASEDLVG